MSEAAFLDLLRKFATDPAARGLMDDAAVLDVAGVRLVLTQDSIVEGVHFLSGDPPADIGWKLAAVNLSDLAAKGARPIACLMSYALSGDTGWDSAFLGGLRQALDVYAMPLIGGDTVAMPRGAARSFTLTAIGEANGTVPARSGAKAGDLLCVTGPVGAAGAGLAGLSSGAPVPQALIDAYRRPRPHVDAGLRLAPLVTAMMDISDGLLIDAQRMAQASCVGVVIEHIPVPDDLGIEPGDIAALMRAATAGDDYVLLFALPADAVLDPPPIRIGGFEPGTGVRLVIDGQPVPLPASLGYSHGT